MATGSVDGLVSGLNTTQLIEQLISVEAAPQTALRTKVTDAQKVVSAYQSLNAKLASLRTAAGALTGLRALDRFTVTSSSDSVRGTASETAAPASLGFDVKSLARAHSVTYDTSVSSLGQRVVAGSTLTLTPGGEDPVLIDVGDGSLASLVAAVNAQSGSGIRANAIQVSPGTYQLQLTATTTGVGSAFTVGPELTLGGATVLDGKDAEIRINGTTGAWSSSNTFSGLLPGLTFTVSKPEDGVALGVERDAGGVADKVKAFVDAANDVLGEIKKNSSYDATTRKGGLLLADGLARRLQTQVLDAVTALAGDVASASTAGVTVTRDGTLSFDRAKFLDAYAKDPSSVAGALGRSGSWAGTAATGGVRLLAASDRTAAGSFDVQLTQVATQASGDVTGTLDGNGQSVTVTLNGATVSVDAEAGDTWQSLADRLNVAAAEAGVGVSTTLRSGGDGLRLTAAAYGDDQVLGVAATGLTAGTVTPGQDVQGRINGQDASGDGQVLSLAKSGDRADGLALVVTLAAPDSGRFAYRPGLAQRLASLALSATDRGDGLLTRAVASKQSWIDDLNDRISDWDRRLGMRRTALQRQFGALEVALGKMRDQSNWLAGQIAGLPRAS